MTQLHVGWKVRWSFVVSKKLFLEPHTKTLNDWRWQGLGWKHQKKQNKKKLKRNLENVSVQLVWHNPSLQNPVDRIVVWKDIMFSL